MNWIVTVSSEKSSEHYLSWLWRGGVHGIAVWPSANAPDVGRTDAMLLSGGGDVAPWRYGANAEPETANVNEARDEMEIELVRLFMAAGKPVFGICRGIQILNVAMGGGMIQHLPRILSGGDPAEIHRSSGKDDVLHNVVMNSATRMGQALCRVRTVNSAHHQAVDRSRLAPRLTVTCLSDTSVVEALESSSPDGKLSAVQWHPERLPASHPASGDLLRFWIEMASGINPTERETQ
jgi:putative glutamine amidotransferase